MLEGRLDKAAALLLWCAGSLYGEVKVLEDFTLIDGTRRPPETHVSMIIDNGRIRSVGPASQIRIPAGAERINLAGKFVMPGIINLHGHIGNTVDLTQDAKFYTRENIVQNLKTYASYGVTTVLSMGTEVPVASLGQFFGACIIVRITLSGRPACFSSISADGLVSKFADLASGTYPTSSVTAPATRSRSRNRRSRARRQSPHLAARLLHVS